MAKYLLVGNPTAQSGTAQKSIDKAMRILRGRGQEVELLPTEPDGKTVPLIAARLCAGHTYASAIALGGDGTFAEVAKGIMTAAQPAPLGMLPSGTGNDQGKSFGLRPGESAFEANVDIILANHTIRLDAGLVVCEDPEGGEGPVTEWFFDSLGWGLQSEILRVRSRDKKAVEDIPIIKDLYRDRAVYAGAFVDTWLNSLNEPVKFDVDCEIDGEPHHYEGLTDLIVNATAIYGGSWVLDRTCEPDDGFFELIPIAGRRDWFSKAIRDLALSPLNQQHLDLVGIKHAEGTHGADFKINVSRQGRGVPAQIDGEQWVSGTRFSVKVHRGAVPLIVRQGWTPIWKDYKL